MSKWIPMFSELSAYSINLISFWILSDFLCSSFRAGKFGGKAFSIPSGKRLLRRQLSSRGVLLLVDRLRRVDRERRPVVADIDLFLENPLDGDIVFAVVGHSLNEKEFDDAEENSRDETSFAGQLDSTQSPWCSCPSHDSAVPASSIALKNHTIVHPHWATVMVPSNLPGSHLDLRIRRNKQAQNYFLSVLTKILFISQCFVRMDTQSGRWKTNFGLKSRTLLRFLWNLLWWFPSLVRFPSHKDWRLSGGASLLCSIYSQPSGNVFINRTYPQGFWLQNFQIRKP